MKKTFLVTLKIWAASDKGKKVDFAIDEKLQSDIAEAIQIYNQKYGGYKVLEFLTATEKTITVKLTTILPDNQDVDVSRAISYFSKQLYERFAWNELSSVRGRLFTVIEKQDCAVKAENPFIQPDISSNTKMETQQFYSANETKEARLHWLYATLKYINTEIQVLEREINNPIQERRG
jgi:hypothetical protein